MVFDPKKSELEVKYIISKEVFDLDGQELLNNFLMKHSFEKPFPIWGQDSFYNLNGKSFRIRNDTWVKNGKHSEFVLTVKKRTSKDSLVIREEVDLTVPSHDDPHAFFQMLGAEYHFNINKNYVVWKEKFNNQAPTLSVAMYSAQNVHAPKRYFLEVEVDKDGPWGLELRLKRLEDFCLELEAAMKLDKPVNLSLYEAYKPKDEPEFKGPKC